MKSKAEFRAHFKSILAKFPHSSGNDVHSVFSATEALAHNLLKVLSEVVPLRPYQPAHSSQYWAAYKNLKDEPSCDLVTHQRGDLQWCYPVVQADHHLHFLHPQIEHDLTKNQFGIFEPDPQHSQEIVREDIAGLLIPGLAFDSSGIRLGRGKGYYDRWLAGYAGLKVGICFDIQLFDGSLPQTDFDIPMDWVVTEKRILSTHASRTSVKSSGRN
jgi:5,10-methenyltetrahydrofolate synthetase